MIVSVPYLVNFAQCAIMINYELSCNSMQKTSISLPQHGARMQLNAIKWVKYVAQINHKWVYKSSFLHNTLTFPLFIVLNNGLNVP